MKKMLICLVVFTLLLQSLSVSVLALDIDSQEVNEQAEVNIQGHSESIIEEEIPSEFDGDVFPQIEENNEEANEMSEEHSDTNEELTDEILADKPNTQESDIKSEDVIEIPKTEESQEKTENLEVVDGITYEWSWEESSFTLDFNASGGKSEVVLSIMEDHNLLAVQHLTLRNLPLITSSFQSLSYLKSLTFTSNTTITQSGAFSGLTNLENVYGEVEIRVDTDRVFADNIRLSYFQPRFGIDRLTRARNAGTYTFEKTQLEEIQVTTNPSIYLSPIGSQEGQIFGNMFNLRRLRGSALLASPYARTQLKDQFAGSYNIEELSAGAHTGMTDESTTFYRDDFFEGFINLKKFSQTVSTTTSAVFNLEAFYHTPNLKELRYDTKLDQLWYGEINNYLPNLEIFETRTMREISSNMFLNHTNIREVIVPEAITFGNSSFRGTTALKKVQANKVKTFTGDSQFNSSSIEEIAFPELEEVGHFAFNGNNQLLKVDLPKLKASGWELFSYCSSLEDVNLPLLETLRHASFVGTSSLRSLTLPSANLVLENIHFRDSGLKYLILPKIDMANLEYRSLLNTEIDYLEVGFASDANQFKNILNQMTYLKELRIIKQQEFDDTFSDLNESINTIEKITLDSITVLGNNIFKSMSSLKNIEAPNLKEIGISTFERSGVTRINFPLVESVGSKAFSNTPVIDVRLPKLLSLENSVLDHCTLLERVDFPLVEYVGSSALRNTVSLKSIEFPNVTSLTNIGIFHKSGVEILEFPKLENLGIGVFHATNELKYLSIPNIKSITNPDDLFYMTAIPYDMEIEGATIHGISTTWRNSSSVEVIYTNLEHADVIKPLLETQNNKLLGIALDGTEDITGETEFNLLAGDKLHVPVESTIIINESLDLDNIKATVNQRWIHDGFPTTSAQNLTIESVMPWDEGRYEREIRVNFSGTGEELFSYKLDKHVLLNVSYSNELEVFVDVKDEKITIGDTTQVATIIKNNTGFGTADVSIDLITGLLNGLEIIEDSMVLTLVEESTGISKKDSLSWTEGIDYTIPSGYRLEIKYEVFGINNESVENNIQTIVHEKTENGKINHTWGASDRLIVENGRIRFVTVPELIEFKGWEIGDDMFLGDVTPQEHVINFQIEDLRGTERSAENEIDATRTPWRLEVSTDDVFYYGENQRSKGNLRVVAQENGQNWQEVKNSFSLFQKNTWQDIPIEQRYTDVSIGEKQKLGIMIDQLSGFPENEILDVELTFELLHAP